MKILGFPTMPKKDEFIHIRSDEELKAALEQDAARNDRKLSDHARYLLRLALGLSGGGIKSPPPVRPPTDVEALQERIEQLEREVLGSRKLPKKRAG